MTCLCYSQFLVFLDEPIEEGSKLRLQINLYGSTARFRR
jgi:uncharacterized protein (DUF1778 family)